jgi:hypothetical protein
MAPFESLNDGQRAVLQLLLRRGKSFDEIAGLLHSDGAAIRSRAHAAAGALGPDNVDVPPDRRDEIADYLLGQQTASQRAATREYLEASPAGRSWARAVSAALAPVAGADKLPDVPAEREEVAEAFGALEARAARQAEVQRAAKRGSWIISAGLGVVVALVVIGVIALVKSGGDGNGSDNAVATTSTTGTGTTPGTGTGTTASPATDPQILAEGALRPPDGSGSTASGQVAIVRFPENNRYRLALTAKGIPPSSSSGSAYAVWFYSSPSNALFLGFPDKVVGANGRLDTVADLSPDTPNYKDVLLTSERSNKPTKPGTVVLRARLVIAGSGSGSGGSGGGGSTTTPGTTTTP